MFQSQHYLAILGPTASGKSDVAISIAQTHNGEVISCDSRQIYRGMDIGSGKVARDAFPKDDYFSQGIHHHLLDTISPRTPYNVAKFQKKANRTLLSLYKKQKLPILCGGTGMWAQAVIEQFDFSEGAPNVKLRKHLESLSLEQLQKHLRKNDSQLYARIDIANRIRLTRALEKSYTQKSRKISPKNSNNTLLPKPQDWNILVINPPTDTLKQRILTRLDKRLSNGMLDEVFRLHFEQRVSWKRLDAFGLEYRWVSRYLRGLVSFTHMRDRILIESYQYAKRQRTWLRRWSRQGRELWYAQSPEEAIHIANTFLSKNN